MLLVDAGPLVALIDADDRHHDPLYRGAAHAGRADLIDSEAIAMLTLDAGDMRHARELMRKYRDLPMDLADAALVAVAERERVARVFTLERRDFELYRPHRIGRFQIIP